MSGTSSYNNDKVVTGEVEYPACDPASGAFFQPDYKKNDDLKSMLDGSKDSLKLEAMKRIIGMIAKGRDASDLFPAVVKNVVSKNIEVKKLVYVYLVRYAEEQQDLALLSISTFQRALKDPNQLIRASALRVLSSIRVPMIVPIVMLAIRDSAADMSPYVRKTAAHAIPKLYSLDPEQKEELVAIIDKLLSDKAPLVVGSAAMAFSEVCPDRISLIHRSYRKLCSLLADVDEWGQLALLSVLTMYARACFPDPNVQDLSSDSDSDKPFYESDGAEKPDRSGSGSMDPDHRLLVRAARPLLQSRNAGVVMAVAQLYYHCGPASELPPVAKALVRLLRAPPEVQSVVLNAVASITVTRPGLFEPFLKSFFVRTSDPTHIKLLKLEVLTNLATETSAPAVLREFQTYVSSSDKAFAGATIQAIGRLAATIQSETETCLNGLLQLLSSKDEWVVCEAVVVVKRVVGGGAGSARAAVGRAARLLTADRLAGVARAAGVWLVAEHGAKHPRAAKVLAYMAAGFAEQEELVKLQLLSLAMKLSITQPTTLPLCSYVVSLARYDASYDVRDRARMLRRILEPKANSQLAPFAAEIFCPDKPSPTIESSFKERSQFPVGSLSQYVGAPCLGHRPMPPHPRTAQDAALRNTAPPPAHTQEPQKNKTFYSEPESSGSESSSSSSEEESSDEDESNEEKKVEKAKEANNYKSSNSGSSDSESDSGSSSSSSEEESEEESSEEEGSPGVQEKQNDISPPNDTKGSKNNAKSNLELLLELDEAAGGLPTMTPTLGGLLTPAQGNEQADPDAITSTSARLVPATRLPLVPAVAARGLRVAAGWPRHTHIASRRMTAVTLYVDNTTQEDVSNLRIHKKTLTGSRSIVDFPPIQSIAPGASASALLGVDFADSIQPIEFTVQSSLGEVAISITPPIGELLSAVIMSSSRWDTELLRLRGMNESDKKVSKLPDDEVICQRVFETANVADVSATGDVLRFAGRLTSSDDLVLVCVRREVGSTAGRVVANCGNMAVAAMLANAVANAMDRE